MVLDKERLWQTSHERQTSRLRETDGVLVIVGGESTCGVVVEVVVRGGKDRESRRRLEEEELGAWRG